MDDDISFREDRRCAPHGEPKLCATGERFWVLRVNLYQSDGWPVDCVTRLLIWEVKDADETLMIEHGKYWPDTDEEDDGA